MRTERTESGIYFRRGESGSAAYSPYTGSCFAIDPRCDSVVKEWLESCDGEVPYEIKAALGEGWAPTSRRKGRSNGHILPDDNWGFMNSFDGPLVINWLLTGRCSYECPYCYAQDLMNGHCKEPKASDVERIAKNILSFDPLAVVLTGGDPLLSPHLQYAIELLHRRAGVIVDTSGCQLSDEHIESFRNHRVFVRISLDSELSKDSCLLRPMKHGRGEDTGDIALQAISECLSCKVDLGVQTVVTGKNYCDFESLRDKLQRLGVCNWRIMRLADTKETHAVFQKLKLSIVQDRRFIKIIYPKLKSPSDVCKEGVMSVQLVENDVANAVILVSPDGVFYTESAGGSGKPIIDPSNKTKPRKSTLVTTVDMHAHARRYLHE